jgi:hypothetical protein
VAYFTIYQGLRGCYMPDSAYTIRAITRKKLKSALQWEADSIRDAGMIGCNKRAIAWLAAAAWRNRRKASGEYVAPYRDARQSHYPYALGVFVGASRADYLASQEGN